MFNVQNRAQILEVRDMGGGVILVQRNAVFTQLGAALAHRVENARIVGWNLLSQFGADRRAGQGRIGVLCAAPSDDDEVTIRGPGIGAGIGCS